MDTTTIPPENDTPRKIAVYGMIAMIVLALIALVVVGEIREANEQKARDVQQCQMDQVRGGASLGMAELLCGKA